MFDEVALPVKFIFAKFFYTTSNATVIFAVSCALCALVYFRFVKSEPKRINVVAPLMAVLIIFVLNFTFNAYYYHYYDIPYDTRIICWNGHINGYDSIMHSHILKPVISLYSTFFGIFLNVSGFDMGDVFSSFYPKYIYMAIAFLYAYAIVTSLGLFRLIYNKYKSTPIMVAFFIIFVQTFKAALDGGILSGYAIFALAIGFILLLLEPQNALAFFKKYLTAITAFSIIMPALIEYLLYDEIASFGDSAFACLVIYVLLAAQRLSRYRIVLISLYLCINFYYDYKVGVSSLSNQIQSGYFITVGKDLLKTKTNIGKPTSAYEIYKTNGENPLKPKKTFIYNQNVFSGESFYAKAKIIPINMQNSDTKVDIDGAKITGASLSGGFLEFKITFSDLPISIDSQINDQISKNNFYVYLYTLNDVLQAYGAQEYILALNK